MSIKSKLDYRYIYVLGNWAYPFRYKLGIAKDVEKRKTGINKGQRGKVYDIFWIKVFFAHQIEGFLHLLYAPLNAKMTGSGHTEWFWMIFPVSPILILIAVWLLQLFLLPAMVVGGLYWILSVANA
jgi:hypothetical protein